jgi:hypothetical protein
MEVLRVHSGRGIDIAKEFQQLCLHACGPQTQIQSQSQVLTYCEAAKTALSATGAAAQQVAACLRAGFVSEWHAVLLLMLEYPLRIFVAIAEAQAGLWVRNGIVMPGQVTWYTCALLRPHTFQLDLAALQLATCALQQEVSSAGGDSGGGGDTGAEQLLGNLLDKFRVRGWVCGDSAGALFRAEEMGGRSAVEAEKLVALLGELLTLIIMILCERELVAPVSEEVLDLLAVLALLV